MAANYLEQLVGEWYEYRGYFVRRNVLVGKRSKGGYECELDVVAFHPANRHLVQVEPSTDADSWSVRERRYGKKFDAGKKHIRDLFRGLDLPPEVEQIALFVYGSDRSHKTVGGGTVVTIGDFLVDIFQALKSQGLANQAVPEHMPILRSFQFVSEYRRELVKLWEA